VVAIPCDRAWAFSSLVPAAQTPSDRGIATPTAGLHERKS
jgi:hypothetical protein